MVVVEKVSKLKSENAEIDEKATKSLISFLLMNLVVIKFFGTIIPFIINRFIKKIIPVFEERYELELIKKHE